MVTYDATDKILFSADAFGTFGALSGNIYADELDFEREWLGDARRYYANIVGKYGNQTQALLDKAAALQIDMVCPLHGPIWRKNFAWFVEKYQKWAAWEPEDQGAVMIAYASVYGNTANAADILALKLAERGVKNIVCYDLSVTDSSVIVAEAFRCSHLVFASTTYNAGIFIKMEEALLDLQKHALKNRTVGIIENGSWMPSSGSKMRELVSQMEGMRILDVGITIKSALKEGQLALLDELADQITAGIPKESIPQHDFRVQGLDAGAFFKFTYGLFVLTSRDGGKDNGCIINTAIQLTDNPKMMTIAVNKANFSRDIIKKTGVFTVSMLTRDAPFKLFQDFGFRSGRDCDKFDAYRGGSLAKRGENGLYYLNSWANAFVSGRVVAATDYGSHTLFVAEVTEAGLLSNAPSLTYQYYADNVKPKRKAPAAGVKKQGWICKVCGYVHEGADLPADFVCPLCKHGADSFERL
jgi:flavin reductase (DIM6/NTAB) family NADH-FMN oxidoreductase RutF/rubredoxin/flavodoxin